MNSRSPERSFARSFTYQSSAISLAFEKLSSFVLMCAGSCLRDRLSTATGCYWDACRGRLCAEEGVLFGHRHLLHVQNVEIVEWQTV